MQSRNTENKVLLLNKVTTKNEHFLQILKIIHFSNHSTEIQMDYFHKDNIPGTHRPSKLFFYVNIYLQ